jgi:hypothetical protein
LRSIPSVKITGTYAKGGWKMGAGYRCIVTGRNEQGKSIVAEDSQVEIGPLGIIDFWKSSSVPASLAEESGALAGPVRLEPPPGGVLFRFFLIPPERPNVPSEEAERAAAAAFAAAGGSHCRVDTARHPMMHTTATIDYVVLLSGEVTLLLDEDEIALRPFDVVVQRGTNHYWINRRSEPALLMGVLLDAG